MNKKKNTKNAPGVKLIATNPNGKRLFHIDEVVEAGMVLKGTEIKSIRNQSPNLRDAYVDVRPNSKQSLEAWLKNAHIPPYSHGNIWNHEPDRARKLLLHRKQITRLFGAITQKGQTIVPLRMYFKQGNAKIEIGLGKGKKKHDKRDDVKKRSSDREMARATKRERR